jgi:hypothetical protein
MEQCLIAGCQNEAKLVAKSGGRSYYSCKEHKKEVAQIVAAEHSKTEKGRYVEAAKRFYPEEENKAPKWLGFE